MNQQNIQFQGVLKKMTTQYHSPILYFLSLKDDFVQMNQLLGKKIKCQHTANQCMHCGLDKPIFRMGYCKSCFFIVPETQDSVLKPELSKAHLGIAERDLEWEQKMQLQPHVVYLAISGGLKVGVTRATQVPTRWIDQGATQAIVLAKTENRYQAGQIEVLMKNYLADKTHYIRMLKNENPEIDLLQKKHELKDKFTAEWAPYFSNDDQLWEVEYPVTTYPTKVKSINLSKTPEFEGKLLGIKGQYLLLDDGKVFNVRNHEGYVVNLKIE